MGSLGSKSWDAYLSGTQLLSELGGVTLVSLTRKPRPERQGSQPKVTQHSGQPRCMVALVTVGRREEGGGCSESQGGMW